MSNMDISPLEFQKKEFSKSLRGYNPEEVDEFVDKLLESYENIYRENRDLKEKIQLLEEKIQNYRDMESTLKNTLVLAEKTAEEVRNAAERERETILKEASLQAKEILHRAKKQFEEINTQNEELRQQFHLYKIRFKNFLQAQLDYLDSVELDTFPYSDSQSDAVLEAATAEDEEARAFATDEDPEE